MPTREHHWLLKEKHHGVKTPRFYFDCARLTRGEPLDYIIGFSPFLDCAIGLEYRPLIPRPETEYWTEKLIAEMRERRRPLRVLDLFAGSGCIGIAILKHASAATVDFGELDTAAVTQIEKNIARNELPSHRARVIQTDIFSHIHGRYNYIVANPPYISPSRLNRVQHSVAAWEPPTALFARGDGLFFIKKLLREAPRHLRPHGTLVIEFDSRQKPAIARFIREQCVALSVRFERDQYGRWRTLRANVEH
jgi:HemK-like putative methylase